MRIDTGVDSLDTFWVTMKNRKGEPIKTGGGEFKVELFSPTSPEMTALRNYQLDKNEVGRLKFRRKVRDDGVLTDAEELEERVWKFMEDTMHVTAMDTAIAAVKSWKNFPRIVDPVTRKPLEPQPPAPECNRENVQNFFRENPDMFLQVKEAYNEEKNYLTEPVANSLASSSNLQGDNTSSTSPKETAVSADASISEPPIPVTTD